MCAGTAQRCGRLRGYITLAHSLSGAASFAAALLRSSALSGRETPWLLAFRLPVAMGQVGATGKSARGERGDEVRGGRQGRRTHPLQSSCRRGPL